MQKARSDDTTSKWFKHSSADRVSTKTVVVTQLKKQYPNLHLTVTSQSNLLGFAAAGHAEFSVVADGNGELPTAIDDTEYIAPARRLDPSPGYLVVWQTFAK